MVHAVYEVTHLQKKKKKNQTEPGQIYNLDIQDSGKQWTLPNSKARIGLIYVKYYGRKLILPFCLNANVRILDKLVHKTSSLATLLIAHRLCS